MSKDENDQSSERTESVASQTYDTVKELILSCALVPGSPVVEVDLARRLGVSRSPLREALRRIEEEGFIEPASGRYRLIATITCEKVLRLYEFRCVLESFAADRAEGMISHASLDVATRKFASIAEELDRSNVQPFNNADFEFHQLYVAKCGNPFIINQLAKLESQLRRVWNFVGPHPLHTRLSFQEHIAIVEAIKSPRPGSLSNAVEHHILAVGRRLAAFVEQRG